MKVVFNNIPDITDYMQYITTLQVASDITIVVVYKTLYRSDDVLVDIYLNEIADDTKIISGRKLTKDSIVSLPKHDLGFAYLIRCVDPYRINTSLNKYNAHKFYLQFVLYEGEDWSI